MKPTQMQQKCFDICCSGKNCITVRVMLCFQDGRFQCFGFGLCKLLVSLLFSEDGMVVVFEFKFLRFAAFVSSMRCAGDFASSDVRRAASITFDACDQSACDASWLRQTLSRYF